MGSKVGFPTVELLEVKMSDALNVKSLITNVTRSLVGNRRDAATCCDLIRSNVREIHTRILLSISLRIGSAVKAGVTGTHTLEWNDVRTVIGSELKKRNGTFKRDLSLFQHAAA